MFCLADRIYYIFKVEKFHVSCGLEHTFSPMKVLVNHRHRAGLNMKISSKYLFLSRIWAKEVLSLKNFRLYIETVCYIHVSPTACSFIQLSVQTVPDLG